MSARFSSTNGVDKFVGSMCNVSHLTWGSRGFGNSAFKKAVRTAGFSMMNLNKMSCGDFPFSIPSINKRLIFLNNNSCCLSVSDFDILSPGL